MTSPTMLPVTCVMSGGPQDGVQHKFDVLPVMLYARAPQGGFYVRTEHRTTGGAHIFEYRRREP